MTETSGLAEAPSPRPSLRALLPLLPYGFRYRGRIALALIALLVASASTLSVPVAAGRLVDFGFATGSTGLVNSYFLAMAGVVAILACASGARYYLVMTIGERVVADLRADLFAHLTRLDATFHDTARTGDLVSRLSADTTQLKAAFGSSISIALRNVFLFLGATVAMVLTSPRLSAFVLVAIPIIVLPLVASGRTVRARSRAAQDRLADSMAFAAENLAAIRTMQAFGAESRTARRFTEAVEAAYDAVRNATQFRAVLTTVALFLSFGSIVGVLWLGAHDVTDGRITGGLLLRFIGFAFLGGSSLGELSQVWSEVSAAAGAASRVADMLAIAPRIAAPAHPRPYPQPAQGTVAFEAVNFAYPTRPEHRALSNLSFTVKAGERVALVGPSGGGKSTIFALLMRFYDPDEGRVLIDGIESREADPLALRQHIALVPQDPVIFGANVSENIAYGEDASPAAIAAAADRAAATPFIDKLPAGYDTPLGERGVTLSGGQKQRLAIARAILRDAPILLLDEATSALDAESESLVQAALDHVMAGRTTLVIAHRLATILKADRILVIDGGRIVEEGTHASLVAAGGLYARLARLQFDSAPARDAAE